MAFAAVDGVAGTTLVPTMNERSSPWTEHPAARAAAMTNVVSFMFRLPYCFWLSSL